MKSFIDNNTDGNKTFLLYGKLEDIFYPTTREVIFDELLNDLLKDRGYNHIIYYSGAGNKGKHCYDLESAKFFFNNNSFVSDQPSTGNSVTNYTQPSGLRRRGQNRNKRGRKSEEFEDNFAESENSLGRNAEIVDSDLNSGRQEIRFGQVDIANSEFIKEITRYINNNEKFAVVFYNVIDFLEDGNNGTNRQFLDQIISIIDKPFVQAICIFEAPLKNNDHSLLSNAISNSQLRYKFMVSAQSNALNRFNAFRIGSPGEDEVANLLRRCSNKTLMRLENCMPISFNYANLSEYAHLLLHEAEISSSEDTSLNRIKIQLIKWIKANKDKAINGAVPFDDLAPAEVFERDENTSEIEERRKPAIERLNRKGWEPVYTYIKQIVEFGRKQYEKIKDSVPPEKPDVCVNRLAGLSSIGSNKGKVPIPNFVFTGNPGTGKTEIGQYIAEILYSENILPTSKCLCVGKAELSSSYVAGTTRAVLDCADRADGGVLMIDEAPQIVGLDGEINDDGTGAEIVQTLNRIMTDPTRHLCVVLTGYKEGMEKLFKIDPGFRSRFGDNEIHIDDYDPKLLGEIFRNALKNINGLNYTLSNDLYDPETAESSSDIKYPFDNYMEHLYQKRDRRTFGNARDMKTLANIIARKLPYDRTVVVQEDFYGPAPFGVKDSEDNDWVDETWFDSFDPSDSMDELIRVIKEDYVGLDYIADRFREIEARVKETCAVQGFNSLDKMKMRSFVLVGNPGTGKDVVANLLARLFKILGVLNYPEAIAKDGSDLASKYTGGSVEEAKNWVKEAQEKNALLFINEAHQLCNEHFDGKGALKAFIAPMTNKSQFVSAFAVYPNELEKFYKLDAGLESRLEVIRLMDYTDTELFDIFKVMCKKKQRDPSEVLDIVSRVCLRLYREHQPNDGNARQMETLISEMDDRRIARCNRENIAMTDENGVLNPERLKFSAEDIPPKWLVRLPDRGCNDTKVSDFEEIRKKLENKVIGRKELVERFQSLSDEIMEAKILQEKGIEVDAWPRPIILAGNPGSGKTMIGRLLAELYNLLGIVNCNEPLTFDATQIATKYKNGETENIKVFINEAIEKHALLFVDEAHQLLEMHDSGKGAIQALVSPMNDPDPERRVALVLAVYDHKVDEFLAADSGLSRRVNVIRLRDYTGPELKEIFLKMAKDSNTIVSPELNDSLDAVFENLAVRQANDFRSGNAGMSERLLEDMNDRRRERCRKNGIQISADDEYMTLLSEDIPEEMLSKQSKRNYKDIPVRSFDEIRGKLENKVVGRKELVRKFQSLHDRIMEAKALQEKGVDVDAWPRPIILAGNPGSGKTMIGRLLAELYTLLGVIRCNEPLTFDATEIATKYKNGETENIKAFINEAIEKHALLFVDEAHQLLEMRDSKGAIQALVSPMNDPDPERRVALVLAVYDHKVDEFLAADSGLNRRVEVIRLRDYTGPELKEIFLKMAENSNIIISDELNDSLDAVFENLAVRQDNDFRSGNAGMSERLLEDMNDRRRERCRKNGIQISADDEYMTLLPEDIPNEYFN